MGEPNSAEKLVGGIRRQVRALERQATVEDPWVAAELLKLADELTDAGHGAVKRLRLRGVRWEAIGYSLGISADAANKRHARWMNSRARRR